jgi:hypothetical protein
MTNAPPALAAEMSSVRREIVVTTYPYCSAATRSV